MANIRSRVYLYITARNCVRPHNRESRLNPSRRVPVDKARERLPVYPLIFYARALARADDRSAK